ncbi:MAG: CopG family transcriptional regulator [Bdellovibrionales bacterium]|nr:CopG family transcriptional regulator [Bdellovibrionales bacterium]
MRSSKVVSVSLPPDMTKEVQELAKEERRSVSEVIREAFRQYAANKALQDVRKSARKAAKAKGIKASDIDRIVQEGRGR